mgnify:FL=1
MSNTKLLAGRRALVTGAGKGIGAKIIDTFAAAGAHLIVCVRLPSQELSDQLAALEQQYGIQTEVILFDLKNESAIKQAMKALCARKIQVNILVNNAGVAAGGLLGMTSLETIKSSFQVNFFAPVLITQYITKLMIKQGQGSIINLGSIAGLDNFPGYTAYGSSKAALMQFTRIIANELAPHGIRVNSIAPALIDTQMAQQMEDKAATNMLGRSAMRRLGRPQEIADLALYLASDQSSFVNGQIIRADGGM